MDNLWITLWITFQLLYLVLVRHAVRPAETSMSLVPSISSKHAVLVRSGKTGTAGFRATYGVSDAHTLRPLWITLEGIISNVICNWCERIADIHFISIDDVAYCADCCNSTKAIDVAQGNDNSIHDPWKYATIDLTKPFPTVRYDEPPF